MDNKYREHILFSNKYRKKYAHKKLTIALPWMPTLPLGRTNEDCSHTTAKHNKTTLKNCKT